MAFDYSGLEATADKLVEQFGRPAVYRQRGSTIPDSARPWEVTKSDTDSTVTAVFLEFSDRERDGTMVQENDSKILLAAKNLGLVPTAGDMVVDGSEVYVVVNASEVKPGGTAMIYELHVRK